MFRLGRGKVAPGEAFLGAVLITGRRAARESVSPDREWRHPTDGFVAWLLPGGRIGIEARGLLSYSVEVVFDLPLCLLFSHFDGEVEVEVEQ
jgi:hypothetical protein